MSRKKTAKGSAKRQASSTIALSMTQKLEKDFLEGPTKIATQLQKEIATLKQKEDKLKNACNKIKGQVAASEKRIKAAANAKNTAAGKKQLNVAKKAHGETLKQQSLLNKQLIEASKAADALIRKQAKLAALRKNLIQFEKEWAKNAKKIQAQAKAKAKAKVKTKAKSARKIHAAKVESTSPIEQVSHDAFDSNLNDVRMSETTEVIS